MTESWAQAAHFAADDKCLSKLRSEFGDVLSCTMLGKFIQPCNKVVLKTICKYLKYQTIVSSENPRWHGE